MTDDPNPQEPLPATRERLIAAGRELFGKQGFARTSTRDLAAAAGCNLSLIRYYFGSKEGLLRAVVQTNVQTVGDAVRSALASDQPIEVRAEAFISFMLSMASQNQDFIRVMFLEVLASESELRDEASRLISSNLELGAQLFAGAQAEGRLQPVDPRYAAMLAMGMVLYYFLAYPVTSRLIGESTPERIEELKRNVVEILLHGVIKPAPAAEGRVP